MRKSNSILRGWTLQPDLSGFYPTMFLLCDQKAPIKAFQEKLPILIPQSGAAEVAEIARFSIE